MAQKPSIVISAKSAAERALLRVHFASLESTEGTSDAGAAGAPPRSTSWEVIEQPDGAASIAGKPDLVVWEVQPGQSQRELAVRLRGLAPNAAIVLLVDAAGPVRTRRDEAEPVHDAVLVRPLTMERLDAVLAPLLRRAAWPSKPRVLVVDDDPEVLHFVAQVLGQAGCTVTAVSDPRVFLARRGPYEFDLALLDVVMPEVDGLDICLRLRDACRDDLRICMMSVADDPETVRKADLYGADEFLSKPLYVRDLHALIERARPSMAQRRAGPPQLRMVEPPALEEPARAAVPAAPKWRAARPISRPGGVRKAEEAKAQEAEALTADQRDLADS